MRKAAVEKLAMLGDTVVADADDIDTLQNALSEELFDKAVAIFMESGNGAQMPICPPTVSYFKNECVNGHKGWFVSFLDGPATNNRVD